MEFFVKDQKVNNQIMEKRSSWKISTITDIYKY